MARSTEATHHECRRAERPPRAACFAPSACSTRLRQAADRLAPAGTINPCTCRAATRDRCQGGVNRAGGFRWSSAPSGLRRHLHGPRRHALPLVSREIISDWLVRVQARAAGRHGLLAAVTRPPGLMAAARLDLAAVFRDAGSICPSTWGPRGDHRRRFRGGRRVRPRAISRYEVTRSTRDPRGGRLRRIHGAPWASAAEALAWRCPLGHPPAVDRRRDGIAAGVGRGCVSGCGWTRAAPPADPPREAFENATPWSLAFAVRPTRCCTCWPSPGGRSPGAR